MRKIISTIATIAILACVAIGVYFVMDSWYVEGHTNIEESRVVDMNTNMTTITTITTKTHINGQVDSSKSIDYEF